MSEQPSRAAGIQSRLRFWHGKGRSVNIAAYIVAIVCFLLAAFGAHPFDADTIEVTTFGLAWFAAGHVLP